jgi:3-methyladenine DNA glycosylase AlkD
MQLQQELRAIATDKRKRVNESFFKTGKGQYSEHDRFIGVSVPDIRCRIKPYKNMPLADLSHLISSNIHEERLAALIILVDQYKRSIEAQLKDRIYEFYIKYIGMVNNWDLVDNSAHHIVGQHIMDNNLKDQKFLFRLASSSIMWERRIAIVSTFAFIKNAKLALTFKIAQKLLDDKEDLMHKAVGWMLREAWKKNTYQTEDFLIKHYNNLPRTSLRYAIERMEPLKRKRFLKGIF